MPRRFAHAVVAISLWLSGCSGPPADEAKPVASPSIAISPAVVASGAPIELAMSFAIAPDAPAFQEDYTVFVHILDGDGRMIGAADHLPPSPTRAWKRGETVQYTRSAFAPTTRYVGTATVVVGLYSPATGERLPMAGDLVEPRGVKAGSLEFRERDDPYRVSYHEGWYGPETVRSSGLEWRWSTKSAVLSFPNPKRPMELVMELDQPEAQFEVAQHVELRMGDAVVDGFDVTPQTRTLRRIALDTGQLGDASTVELALVSDKTFVPASVADLHSEDTRQLGIRVFRVYVEPK